MALGLAQPNHATIPGTSPQPSIDPALADALGNLDAAHYRMIRSLPPPAAPSAGMGVSPPQLPLPQHPAPSAPLAVADPRVQPFSTPSAGNMAGPDDIFSVPQANRANQANDMRMRGFNAPAMPQGIPDISARPMGMAAGGDRTLFGNPSRPMMSQGSSVPTGIFSAEGHDPRFGLQAGQVGASGIPIGAAEAEQNRNAQRGYVGPTMYGPHGYAPTPAAQPNLAFQDTTTPAQAAGMQAAGQSLVSRPNGDPTLSILPRGLAGGPSTKYGVGADNQPLMGHEGAMVARANALTTANNNWHDRQMQRDEAFARAQPNNPAAAAIVANLPMNDPRRAEFARPENVIGALAGGQGKAAGGAMNEGAMHFAILQGIGQENADREKKGLPPLDVPKAFKERNDMLKNSQAAPYAYQTGSYGRPNQIPGTAATPPAPQPTPLTDSAPQATAPHIAKAEAAIGSGNFAQAKQILVAGGMSDQDADKYLQSRQAIGPTQRKHAAQDKTVQNQGFWESMAFPGLSH